MLGLVLRVLLSLAVVLGLFWMVARTGSRKLGGRDRALIRVRGRQALSRGSSLAVVEVGSRVLVVGVSDGGVRLLTEMDPDELGSAPQVAPVTRVVAEAGTEAAPDEDFRAAYERASAELATQAPVVTAGKPVRTRAAGSPAVRKPAVAAPAHRLEGPLAGSLLSASTWRLAWSTAIGRGHRPQPGDAT
jgi:flagellar protein FliO/FliZ